MKNSVNGELHGAVSSMGGRAFARLMQNGQTSSATFRYIYRDRQINCDNYPWLARHLNRPHHEIENDPRVCEQIASLIESELRKTSSAVEAPMASVSLPLK